MSDLKTIGKFLTWVLRHHPEEVGCVADEEAYVSVTDLLEGIEKHRPEFKITREDLETIVLTNSKKRFEFNLTQTEIRACQGHSIPVNITYSELHPVPDYLYHGTSDDNIHSILASGINKGTRHHVHLSFDEKTAWEVARRRKDTVPVVLTVKSLQLFADGFKFFVSGNGVALVDFVPADYIGVISTRQIPLWNAKL